MKKALIIALIVVGSLFLMGADDSCDSTSAGTGTSGTNSNSVGEAPVKATTAPAAATPAPPPKPSPTSDIAKAEANLSLKLVVWDDTTYRPATNLEIWTKGLGSYFPDLTYGGDDTVVGPYPVGGSFDLFIYPDGRPESTGGKEIKVTIITNNKMISESDRDAIHVDVSDAKVVVTNTGIEGIEKEFER